MFHLAFNSAQPQQAHMSTSTAQVVMLIMMPSSSTAGACSSWQARHKHLLALLVSAAAER
jgi:hypothetical protein